MNGTVSAGTGITASRTDHVHPSDTTRIPTEAVDRDDIVNRVPSGTWQSSTATKAEGWPEDANNWYHLLSSTHSNTGNYYSMQFAASFFDGNALWFRVTNGSGNAAWVRMWHSGNDGAGSGLDADLLDGKDGSYYAVARLG
jgi:hypothetical protein